MNIEHFKLSLALMERVRDEEMPFRIQFWFTRWFDRADIVDGNGNPNHPCGFAACVAGHMAADPAHNELGFVMSTYAPFEPIYRPTDRDCYSAIQDFWDCTSNQARNICSPQAYSDRDPSIHEVINRMKNMLAEHTKMAEEPA
jgi:hypothetical protein